MKRLRIVVIIVIVLALLILVGMLLFKHFITDQIKDRGGMINPDYITDTDNAPTVDPIEEDVTQ